MQPSFSVTLEPELKQGVPWGCDLYTFVTSAAGHMMKTLQKPRKNRRSKRQVNHRRFLHNMIQRKFAEIEAANQRLAGALYFKEGNNVSSLPSQEPESLSQSGSLSRGGYLQVPDEYSVHTDVDGISKSRSEKKKSDLEHLGTTAGQKKVSRNQGLVESSSISSPIDRHHGAQPIQTKYYDNEGQPKSAKNLSEVSRTTQQDSDSIQIGQNMDIVPVFSPGPCQLSLDSCDFSIQMFTDISTCTQAQKNITDMSEGQWSDIMDLFSIGNKDEGMYMDAEAYFESICDVGVDNVEFASEMEDFYCEGGEYRYEYGRSCHGVQGLTVNHSRSSLRQREDTAETQLNDFQMSEGVIQNQLPTTISYHYNLPELQTYQQPQEEGPCMLVNNQNFTLFEGVAQSFSVPLLDPEHRSIPTLPHEDDWLFTDILGQDRTSLDC